MTATASTEPKANVPAEEPLISITNIDQFVKIMHAWHSDKVAQLHHIIQAPDGTEMQIGDEALVLTGDILKGMKTGIELSLMLLGELPFEISPAPSYVEH